MTTSPYHFQDVHPEAYQSFLESGWTEIDFEDGNVPPAIAALRPPILKGINSEGVEVEIPLPTRPGMAIKDKDMLAILANNNIRLRPLEVIDFRTFGEGWGFSKSARGDTWLEKRHSQLPDTMMFFNLSARHLDDVLLIIERLSNQPNYVKLKEVNNLYRLGDFLTEKGWFAR